MMPMVQLWPDAVIESPYASEHYSRAQHVTSHPAIGRSGFNPKRIVFPSNKTVCAGPWSLDIIEALVQERIELTSDPLRQKAVRAKP